MGYAATTMLCVFQFFRLNGIVLLIYEGRRPHRRGSRRREEEVCSGFVFNLTSV